MRKFIAVDGESFTVEDEHRYVLLASSKDDHVYNKDGLSTEEGFEFLLRQRGGTLIAFGWNYDVNMMLRDLDTHSLILLWYNGNVHWNGYSIEWIPGKSFWIKRGKWSAKVNDVFGFFQASFVKALAAWEMDAQPELESMKESRSRFTAEMKSEVIKYCLGECRDLVRLMVRVQDALSDVDLKPKSWVGAGSIASALMEREGVKEHRVPDSEFPCRDEIMQAYFGGRSELFQQGIFKRVWDYDISSAYPAMAMELPSLKDGKWRKVKRYLPDEPYAIWHCRWNLDTDLIVMPFPVRHDKSGSICYPSRGQGWYHGNEVLAAQLLTGHQIEVVGGWVFDSATKQRPFSFIKPVYDYRRHLKRTGHGGEKVLKLGMNSIYGKLAQGLGYKGMDPPFQSFFWAGFITAGTRARILNLAQLAPSELVMVATDGIFFTRELDLETVGGLGGLELTTGEDVFVAQPGVYSYHENGKEIGKTRGFFSKEIDFASLREGFIQSGVTYQSEYPTYRFCGLGSSILNRNMDTWRSWVASTRRFNFNPSTKFAGSPDGQLVLTLHDNPDWPYPVRHYPPRMDNGFESLPYKPKHHPMLAFDEADKIAEFVQGAEQPMRNY